MPLFSQVSGNWADALDPIVRKWWEAGFARRTPLVPRLFNVQSSARAYEEVSGIGAVGIDAWDLYEQAGYVPSADFDQGYKKTYTHKEYPLELEIKRKMLDDNNFPEITRMSRRIGDSMQVKRESDGASVFNNAFTAGSTAGADAVALCSASHPYSPQKTGSTQSNYSAISLNKTNVSTVRQNMMAFTDDNGNKVAVTPNLILVPPALEDTALQIAMSLNDPGTADNDINPQYGRFAVLPWHYLTDTNAWFMIDTNLMMDSLDWFDRVPPSISPKVEDKTISATWIAYMRYSYGWSDWRWVYGCNPS